MMQQPSATTPESDLTREEVMVQILLGLTTDRLRHGGTTARQGLKSITAALDAVEPCHLGGGRLQRRLRMPWVPHGRLLVDEETWQACAFLLNPVPQALSTLGVAAVVKPKPAAPKVEASNVYRFPSSRPEGMIERAHIAERAALRALEMTPDEVIRHAISNGVAETSARGRFVHGLASLVRLSPEAQAHHQRAQECYHQAIAHRVTRRILKARAARAFIDADDAMQEYWIAAMGAAQRFDHARGSWPSTLRWWLQSRGFKLRAKERKERGIAGSSSTQLLDKVRAIQRKAAKLGYSPTYADIAEMLNSTPEAVERVLSVSDPVSLDAATDDHTPLSDRVDDSAAEQDRSEKSERESHIDHVWDVLLSLPAAEAWVLARREGFGGRRAPPAGHKVPPWDSLRRELGVSMEQVRHLDVRARASFAEWLEDERCPDPHLSRASFERLLDDTAEGRGLAMVRQPGDDVQLRQVILLDAGRSR